MPAAARLFPASPKPAGGPVTPAVRAPRIRFARAARDARFQKVIAQLQQSATRVGQHPPARRKAAEAQAAAQAPANEKLAGARANQVDDMKDAKVEKPGKGGFLAILRAEIDKVMPKNLDDADKFMKGGESAQIKGAVGANVSDQKQKASGPTETATKAPPDTGKVEGKEVTAMPADPAAVAPAVAGADAMPAPRPQAEVARTAADAAASADQKLKDAELTETQLQKANDPRFSSVLTARDKAKETAAAGPAKYRAGETAALTQARAGATGDAARGRAGLVGTKTAATSKNKSRAQLAKEADQAERKKVTDTIAAIFDRTKAKVDAKLSTLEADAMALFDAGADAALATMKSSANAEIDKFKDDRYSGLLGKGRWIADLFRDTPPEIKAIIARARQRFTTDMDALAVRVAAIVDNRLAEAKAIVAAGQAEVKGYVAGLAPNLKSVGQKAEQDLQSKFDDLKQSIDDKAQDLAEKLAQKYKDASEKADAAAKEMEEANKGALRALAEKVGEIIKMLAEFADRVVALFKKAAGVLKKIIADPIGFLGNLLSAIKQGISRFVSNIWTHIKNGFMQWLFGELTKGGVQIPDGLPSPGAIIKLVLNVMGLTWANIRPKIVAKIGERAVSVLEKVVEILHKLFTGGPEALWAEMRAFVGNIKAMVLDAIIDWVISKVITSAITKVASMFNPAGAIIQAIIMVYNVGTWLAANLGKILDFIESVLNSVDRIASGDVGGAAAFIELALARMIPILIGFLASLLGLGGLGDKIKSFIKKVQTAVGKAVDFVIDKVFNFVKKLIGKVTGKSQKGNEKADPDAQVRLDAAVTAVQGAMATEGASVEVVQDKLPAIKQAQSLTELKLVKDKEGRYRPEAIINPRKPGPVQPLFTREQLRQIKGVAARFGAQIRGKREQASFLAAPIPYLMGNTKIGDVVEAAGVDAVAKYADGCTVLRGVHLQFQDASGADIGGAQAELDYLILGTDHVKEIVSAKLNPAQVRPPTDKAALRHYQAIPLVSQQMFQYAIRYFGAASIYQRATGIAVSYVDGGVPGRMSLAAFRTRYLAKTVVDKLVVKSLGPSPDGPGDAKPDIPTGMTARELLDKLVEEIKKVL
jgi:hypothetical protein